MIILVDMDGVVADFEKGNAQLFAELGLGTLEVKARKNWDILEGLHSAELRERVLEGWHRPGFFRNLPVIPGAQEAYERLTLFGHQVYFCTAPLRNHATCASEKLSWLAEHFGEAAAGHAIITGDKTLIMGDYLIDDRPNVHGVKSPIWTQLLYAQPYNYLPKYGTRYTWAELLEKLT